MSSKIWVICGGIGGIPNSRYLMAGSIIHFAYPNVIPRDDAFLGCGRYVAAPFGASPGIGYALVELNIPNITEVHLAALQLAPESADSNAVIYERRDPGPHEFRGESRDLAYVLALVSRTRALRLTDLSGDIWCTGRIDIKGENRPFLKAVDVAGFARKLQAFLEPEQVDGVFIVPAANVLPSYEILFQQHQVTVVSLPQFMRLQTTGNVTGKIIVKVQGDELADLVEALFHVSHHIAPAASDMGRNPYRGLFVFREQDSDLFFGRDAAIQQCLERLRQHAFLTVIGPSGSGKSSLMYAGVIPALRRAEAWQMLPCRIGSDPWQACIAAIIPLLASAQSERERARLYISLSEQVKTGQQRLQHLLEQIARKHPGTQFLFLLDQSEELYTLCPDADERRQFFDALLTIPATPQWHLALTMRADFLGKACAHRRLADALQQVGYLLGPMNRDELRAVIERPADMRGVRIEDGLTDRILDALGHEPGTLPLLEFALSQLWDAQHNRTLTHAAYQQIGGVKQALTHYADTLYLRLHPDDQEQARRIFTQLIHPGEGTEDTRRRATRAEIGETSWELVTKLADARLVVTGVMSPHNDIHAPDMPPSENTPDACQGVEVVHEVLIQGWQRLRHWLDAEREFRLWQERLRTAIRQWIGSGQDSGALLRGAMLAEAEAWQLKKARALSAQETAFIQASVHLRNQDLWARKRQQRRNLIGLSAACVLAMLLAVLAWDQQTESERQRHIAEGQRHLAEEQRQLAEKQSQLALMRQQEAEQERQRAEAESRNARQHLHQAEINAIKALSQTSKALLLSNDHFGAVLAGLKAARQAARVPLPDDVLWQVLFTVHEVLDRATEYRRFVGHDGAVKGVSFSPDGALLASAGNDNVILVWNVETGERLRDLRGHLAAVKGLSFSPDGRLLVSGGADLTVRLWDVATGRRLDTLLGHLGVVQSVNFSPDGRFVASGSDDGSVKIWDVSGRARPATFSGAFSPVKCVRFSPDGALLAAGSDDGIIKLWDVERQQVRATLYGHTQTVWSLDFSPDGQWLASGSDDGLIKLWFVADNSEFMTLPGHADGVRSVRFHPQGRLLASGSDEVEKIVKLWDVQRAEVVAAFAGHFNSVVSLDFHPDGQLLASGSDDQQVKVWDISDHAARSTIAASSDPVTCVAVHPEGTLAAYAGDPDGTIALWDIVNQRRFRTIYGYAGLVRGLDFSPDGTLLASANQDHTMTVWEVASGRQMAVLRGHTDIVRDVAFSPDGQWLVSGSADATVKLWELASGHLEMSLDTHLGTVTDVAFHPNGSQFLSAGVDATIRLWERATGTELMVLRNPLSVTPIFSLAVSPDGRVLAAGSGNNSAILWDLSDGSEIRTFYGHARLISSVAFSPDGALLASGSHDHTIKLWSVRDGRELTTLSDHRAAVNSVQFHPVENILLSGGNDGQVKLWNFDLSAYITHGCHLLSGYLRDNPQVAEEDRGLCQDLVQ